MAETIVKLINNSQQVFEALSTQVRSALSVVGTTAEGYAKQNCPVDTGLLRNSITYQVDGDECVIGTNTEYAPYVELGSGLFYAGGRTSPWAFQDAQGNWHTTIGQRAQPFLKPAVADHIQEFQAIINDYLKR